MAKRSDFRVRVESVLDDIGILEGVRNPRDVYCSNNKRSQRVKYCGYMLNSNERETIIEAVRKEFPDQVVDVFNSQATGYSSDYYRGMTIRVFKPGEKGFITKTKMLPARKLKKKFRIKPTAATCPCCGQQYS